MRKAKSSAAPLHNFCGLVHISEMIFPQKNVRFIAINDGVDSAQGDNDFAPLRNGRQYPRITSLIRRFNRNLAKLLQNYHIICLLSHVSRCCIAGLGEVILT